jgi:hypothetical protein
MRSLLLVGKPTARTDADVLLALIFWEVTLKLWDPSALASAPAPWGRTTSQPTVIVLE